MGIDGGEQSGDVSLSELRKLDFVDFEEIELEEPRDVSLSELSKNTRIDMVELGWGCTADCVSCGAHKEGDAKLGVHPISVEQLGKNLSKEIVDVRGGVRFHVVSLLSPVVTTGIDMEPLESDIFVDAVDLIHSLSGGRSRLAAISHGLMIKNDGTFSKAQGDRLKAIVDLMLEDKIPIFVLSVDAARRGGLLGKESKRLYEELKGLDSRVISKIVKETAIVEQQREGLNDPVRQEDKIDWQRRLDRTRQRAFDSVLKKMNGNRDLDRNEASIRKYLYLEMKFRDSVVEANARSYAETIIALLPAIKAGKRVTISLQGDDNEKSLASDSLTNAIYQRMIELLTGEFSVSGDELSSVLRKAKIKPIRHYTGIGRAKAVLGIEEDRPCPVIPDDEFVNAMLEREAPKAYRAVLGIDGELRRQLFRWGTYSDTAGADAAERDGSEFDNPWEYVPLESYDVDTMELYAPASLSFRVDSSIPYRLLNMPSVEEDMAVSDLGEVYPLSEISNNSLKEGVLGMIISYFRDRGLDPALKPGSESEVLRRRELIIEALIPDEETDSILLEDGDDECDCADLKSILAKSFVRHFMPEDEGGLFLTSGFSDFDKRRHAQMLVIRTALEHMGINEQRGQNEDKNKLFRQTLASILGKSVDGEDLLSSDKSA